MIDPKTMPFLPVDAGNHLVLTDSKREQRKGMDNDDDYYNEVMLRALLLLDTTSGITSKFILRRESTKGGRKKTWPGTL